MCEEGFPSFPYHVCASSCHGLGEQEDDGCRQRAVNEEGEGGCDVVQLHDAWGRKERHGEEGRTGFLPGWLNGGPYGIRRQGRALPGRLDLGAHL